MPLSAAPSGFPRVVVVIFLRDFVVLIQHDPQFLHGAGGGRVEGVEVQEQQVIGIVLGLADLDEQVGHVRGLSSLSRVEEGERAFRRKRIEVVVVHVAQVVQDRAVRGGERDFLELHGVFLLAFDDLIILQTPIFVNDFCVTKLLHFSGTFVIENS